MTGLENLHIEATVNQEMKSFTWWDLKDKQSLLNYISLLMNFPEAFFTFNTYSLSMSWINFYV